MNDSYVDGPEFPKVLSEFGFFINQAEQLPVDDVYPYELISTLFSDYSYKKRFIYVPEGTKAKFQKNWVFDFPVGSALIKTFY